MTKEQLFYYQSKLEYEVDSSDLYNELQNDENIYIVVDGRSPDAFSIEHIKGAVNIWHKDICSNSTKDLDKNKIYICYCDGVGCNASTKTALKLLTLGFKVKELIGGLDWWKRDGYETNISGLKESNCGC